MWRRTCWDSRSEPLGTHPRPRRKVRSAARVGVAPIGTPSVADAATCVLGRSIRRGGGARKHDGPVGRSLLTLSVWVTAVGVAVALVANRHGMPRAYLLAKLVASLGFLVAAVAVGAMGAAWTRLAFVALVFSAAGDVALAVRTKPGFLVGLGSFALAHVVYIVAFAVRGFDGATIVPTAIAAALVGGGTWLAFGRRASGSLRGLVAVYVVILSTMLAVGAASAIAHR